MPVRMPPQHIVPRCCRSQCFYAYRGRLLYLNLFKSSFHTSLCFRADNTDYYERLGLSSTATQADIKKQFYHLSKTHHPDRNPNNQEAAAKQFIPISEAYTVLGNPAEREKYDRERTPAQYTSGSYSSSSASSYAAGGRKASGLSRRRGAFRGPPPSFFRSGGWGTQSQKRSANASADSHYSQADYEAQQRHQQQHRRHTGSGFADGSAGSWPFHNDPNDVPHFDREGHYRTHSTVEEQLRQGRNKRRRAWEESTIVPAEGFASAAGQFFLVSGIVMIGLGAPIFFFAGNHKRQMKN